MKGIAKKLITLGLAGVMFGAATSLAGCSESSTQSDASSETQRSFLVSKNTYIIVSENGVDTLHKGDVIVPYGWYRYSSGPASFPTILKFNCGKELQTYQFVAYPQGCPKQDKYDEVCDCAYEIIL